MTEILARNEIRIWIRGDIYKDTEFACFIFFNEWHYNDYVCLWSMTVKRGCFYSNCMTSETQTGHANNHATLKEITSQTD